MTKHSSDTTKELLQQMDPSRLPCHVAIIMDGNGRWAKQRHLPRVEGHRRGINGVREVVEGCCEAGVKFLTLYAFSVENWQRPLSEVSVLMGLLVRFLYDEIEEMNSNGVRLRVTGRRDHLDNQILKAIHTAETSTQNNTRLVLNLAFNYGSRAEIEDSLRAIAKDVKEGKLQPDTITAETLRDYLYSPWLPDPDLLIRTSGELRISNFLLWQMAYTELYFTDTLWPDFGRNDLYKAILDYQKRERRFGKV